MAIDVRGIFPAALTPLNDDETPNCAVVPALVEHLLVGGVHGLFVIGTHGEAYALSTAERAEVTAAFVEAAAGRVPVMAGIGAPTTRGALENLRAAEDAGADAISAVTPFFLSPTQDELYEHMRALAANTDLPMLLYNLPGRTHVHIAPQTLSRLAEIDNIVGVKDSSGDFNNTLDYLRLTGPDFAVMNGNDGLIFASLMAGASGAVAACANIIPDILVGIYEAVSDGDIDMARTLQMKAIPLRRCFSLSTVPDPIKQAARMIGLPVGPTARPCRPMDPSARETLRSVLEHLGLQLGDQVE